MRRGIMRRVEVIVYRPLGVAIGTLARISFPAIAADGRGVSSHKLRAAMGALYAPASSGLMPIA